MESDSDKNQTTSMNISLPTSLRSFVDSEVSARGYTSASEFVRELIRNAKEVSSAEERVAGLLREGIESGEAEPFDDDFFEKLRARVRDGQSRKNRAS